MESVVLVGYATKAGSTKEVAEVVAEVLRGEGLSVELKPLKDVAGLERYDAVVLAAALYMGRLHGDARRFLTMQRTALMKVPVALFVPGPVDNQEKDWDGARQQLDMQLVKFPWLTPVATNVVGGRFDPGKLGFPFNLTLRKMPAKDVRDWEEIRKMAREVAGKLMLVAQG